MSQQQPKMTISSDFFTAYDKLPQEIQNKTISFLSKFRQDPTMRGHREKFLQAGMDDYLTKSVKKAEILEVLNKVMNRIKS